MKRLSTALLAVGLMMALAIPATAADLHEPHEGTMCEFGFQQLHFVHNQHDGQGDINDTIDVTFSNADGDLFGPFTLPATKANRGTVHYTIQVDDSASFLTTLVTASDSIGPGMLVLSDYKCREDGGSGSGGDPYEDN
jgi:hypothetical protein